MKTLKNIGRIFFHNIDTHLFFNLIIISFFYFSLVYLLLLPLFNNSIKLI